MNIPIISKNLDNKIILCKSLITLKLIEALQILKVKIIFYLSLTNRHYITIC